MNPKQPISDKELASLESDIREQYRERINEKGSTPEGLFWDSEESMQTRFDVALDSVDFEGSNIVDIGCGFGDFYGHLREAGVEPDAYHGIDVSEVVLDEAVDRYGDDPAVTFERRNLLRDPYNSTQFDIAVVFGTLGHRLASIDNEAYMRRFMRTSFGCADITVLNALSSYRQGDWPYEEFVYYYDPGVVFGYAQELTRNVRLRHDFEPIPQKEFLLVLEPDSRPDTAESAVTELDS